MATISKISIVGTEYGQISVPSFSPDIRVVVSESGKPVYFSVANSIQADSSFTYQWEVSADSGSTWNNSTGTGNTTNKLKVTAYASRNNNLYRCVVTNGENRIVSDTAKMIVI